MSELPNNTSTDVAVKKGKRKMKRNFETYIVRVLKQIRPDGSITANARQQLSSALTHITSSLCEHARNLVKTKEKHILCTTDVEDAMRLIFPEEIMKHCISQGNQAVDLYTQNMADKTNDRMTRSKRAGINFPPYVTELIMRDFGYTSIKVKKDVHVYTAAVLEYIASDILDLSGNLANDNKRKRINIRDMFTAVFDDIDLSAIFLKLGITFIGCGVLPHIHESLLPDSSRPQKMLAAKKFDTTGERVRKFRPGILAIKEIKKYQSVSNKVMSAPTTFDRIVRDLLPTQPDGVKVKVASNVPVLIQHFVENYLVDVLASANKLAIHAGRKTVYKEDIDLVSRLRFR